jgi:hypothetical protein
MCVCGDRQPIPSAALTPPATGHAHVQEGHVGTSHPGHLDRLLGVRGHAGQFQARVRVDHADQDFPHLRLVVGDEDPERVGQVRLVGRFAL